MNSGVLGVKMVLSEPVARNSMYYCTILVILRGRFGGIPLNSTPFHKFTPILGHIHGNHLNGEFWGFGEANTYSGRPGTEISSIWHSNSLSKRDGRKGAHFSPRNT